MLYLRAELLSKSEEDGKPSSGADSGKPVSAKGRFEHRGGKYAARVQIGYEKDGSPMYRYFATEEDYQTYLSRKGRSKEAKKLERKVKKEHEESSEKQGRLVVDQPASKEPGLLATTKKSFALYVRI
jgi:hypothetical protein